MGEGVNADPSKEETYISMPVLINGRMSWHIIRDMQKKKKKEIGQREEMSS